MKQVFQTVLELSLSGSWLILAILLLRSRLRRFPKRGKAALWGLAAARLLLPFRIESKLSLVPGKPTPQYDFAETVPIPDAGRVPGITTGNWELSNYASAVWLLGMLFFVLWFAFRYFRLRSRLNTAVRLRNNIFQSEFVTTPMVVGFIHPRIYLPFRVDAACFDPILSHEQAHIRRHDQWWKLLAFACLAVHWFNPLVWVAYFLFGRDLEFACDEAVIEKLDANGRADYAQALMQYGTIVRGFSASLLAFGTTDTKGRIQAVARYQRPRVWRVVLLWGLCFLLAVCFLTNPVTAVKEPSSIAAMPDGELSREEVLRNDAAKLKRWLAWYEEQLEINQIWYRETLNSGDTEQLVFYENAIESLTKVISQTEARIKTMEYELSSLTNGGS